MRQNILLEEAQELLLNYCPQTEKKNISLSDALGRVLGEDVKARESIPPFDRSPYDGYAFRAEDTQNATKENPTTLKVIEEVAAGHVPQNKVVKGQAVKILTGAPIPEGANAVIKYEETELKGNFISIHGPVKPGENVVPAGEDVTRGEIIASRGTVITSPVMGLMAALGITRASVYQCPRIAIVSTGDELLDISEPLALGKIRNSNSYTLKGYIRTIGADPVMIGTARDNTEEVAFLIEQGLERADMVITTGGVSVGDYDLVRNAVEYIGAETLYWRIRIKPGSPTLAACKNGKVILGLSGNPAAAMVVFQLLTIPYIKKMAGRKNYLHEEIAVVLKKDFQKASPCRRFLRGKLVFENGMTFMDTTGSQGNGILHSMIGCNVLAEIPEGSGPVQAGEKLTAYLVE
ncbi:MAG: gephyrin-like molybdotransferase Glp [Syntrophomonas sp.]